jgi:hypothetical protein
MKAQNPETVQEGLMANLPAGLERALRRVLDQRVGEESAISRADLLRQLGMLGFGFVDERTVRALINDLRKRGELICSRGGSGGGYWYAASREEMEAYLEHEIHPRAMDLLEQEKALRQAMDVRFGEGVQVRLF